MTKARTLANFISDNNEFADGTISVSEVSGAAPLASPSFTGNVGIGVTPATFYGRALHVHDTGTAGANIRLTDSNSGTTGNDGMDLIQIGNTSYIINREAGGMNFYTGGQLRYTIQGDGTHVFNENSLDSDFRVESDNNTHALFVDASTDNVGIHDSAPTSTLTVQGNKAFAWNANGTDNVATTTIGVRTLVNNQNSFAVSGTTHNTYYPSSWVVDSSHDGAFNLTTFNLTAYGVKFGGWNSRMTFNTTQGTAVHEALRVRNTEAVFNELSNNTDFRVESDTNANAIFVDASAGRVGIGEGNPVGHLHITGDNSSDGATLFLQEANNNTSDNLGRIFFGNNTDNTQANILAYTSGASTTSFLRISTTSVGTQTRNIDLSSANIIFNEDSLDMDFRVESDNYANMLSVDAGNDLVQVVNARLQFEYDTDPTVDTIRETVVNGKTYRGSYGQGYNTLWAKSLYTTISTANRTFPILSVDRHGGNNRVWVKVTMRAAGAVANQGNEAVGYALINADGGDASRTYTSSVTVYGALNTYAATYTLGWNTSADPDVLEVTTIKNANYVALSFDIEVIQQDGNAPVKFLFSTYG